MNIIYNKPQKKYMLLAIKEAQKARERGDYPIGAVVVDNKKILACSGNRVKTKNDSTRHVELEAIQYAKGSIKERYLDQSVLYTTTEPCFMCLGACWWSGIRTIYYGIGQTEWQKYGAKFGNSDLRFRTSPILAGEIIQQYSLPVGFKQFMEKECLVMLYKNQLLL